MTSGVIITNGKLILGCRPFGKKRDKNFLDIPKGIIEENETALDACIRETKEEVNIDINKNILKDLGEFEYLEEKNLHLFLYKLHTEHLPNTGSMRCNSYFEMNGKKLPEMISMQYVHKRNVANLFRYKIAGILVSLIENEVF